MTGSMARKMACAGLLSIAALFAGCGSEDKVAVVDYQRLEAESPKIKAIQQDIVNKNKEIADRMAAEDKSQSQEDLQKKMAAAQQERQIFMQSKQKQIQSLVETQCAAIAKEKQIGIVMHKGTVPVGAVDITDEVLARLNGGASQQAKAVSASK